MITTADILTLVQEQKKPNIKKLSKKLEIPEEKLHEILLILNKHNLIKYDLSTGKITLPRWLSNINKRMEAVKPVIGEIILPRYQEAQIQDISIGNYMEEAISLRIYFKAKRKEIAICKVT